MDRPGPSLRARVRALFAIDLRSLAVFRIALGTLLLTDLATRARFLTTNYSDLGPFPREVVAAYREPGTLPSLHLLAGDASAQALLFAVAGLAAVLLTLGWRTRLATIASWLLLDSLQHRNMLVIYGGDGLLRYLLFWSMFLPLGARASIDALRAGGGRPASSVCSPASAALLLQVACMFFVTGLLKTGPEWTSDWTAIHNALNRTWQVRPFGDWLLTYPTLLHWLTPAVRWLELLAPPALFLPFATARVRLVLIPGLWALVAGFGLGLRLGLFPWSAAIGMLPFVPALAWDAARRGSTLGVRAGDVGRPRPLEPRGLGADALVQAAVLALLLLVLWVNAGVVAPRLAPPPALLRVASVLHLKQLWSMYAPGPKPVDVWLEHRGRLRDGTTVDLDRADGGEAWEEVERAWSDFRFEYALQKIAGRNRKRNMVAYAQWLCRQWNLERSDDARLASLAILRVVRPVPQQGEPQPPTRRRKVLEGPCPGRGDGAEPLVRSAQ